MTLACVFLYRLSIAELELTIVLGSRRNARYHQAVSTVSDITFSDACLRCRIMFDELGGEGCSECTEGAERERKWCVAMVIRFKEQVGVLQGVGAT